MDQTKIWSHFQNHDEGALAFNARPRYEYIARRITAGSDVLNIGVGRGGLEELLVRKGAIVSSLDPDAEAICRIAGQYGLGDRARVGFSQSVPFDDNSFNVVIVSEVLEHLNDDVLRATISEVWRVLKAGGKLIGTVPAAENLTEQRVVCPSCGLLFHRWGHQQSFDNAQLRKAFGERFYVELISRHFFGEVRGLNWKGRIVLIGKKILIRLGLKGNGETLFFVAQKQ